MVKNKIKKILVPLDGSENSQRGLEMAIQIARATKSTITGVYSIFSQSRSEFSGIKSVQKAFKKEAKEIMEKATQTAAENGILLNPKIMSGDTGFNIVTTANKGKFDLIVIGSRGRSKVKEIFLGSVSNYVLHASKIPVLVVK